MVSPLASYPTTAGLLPSAKLKRAKPDGTAPPGAPACPRRRRTSLQILACESMGEGVGRGSGVQPGEGGVGETEITPRISSQRLESLYECDPPICNQGLISQLTASSGIISIQTN